MVPRGLLHAPILEYVIMPQVPIYQYRGQQFTVTLESRAVLGLNGRIIDPVVESQMLQE